jgi:hypothetical protein
MPNELLAARPTQAQGAGPDYRKHVCLQANAAQSSPSELNPRPIEIPVIRPVAVGATFLLYVT